MKNTQYKIPEGVFVLLLFQDAMAAANSIYLDELRSDTIRRVPSSKGIAWAFEFILASSRPHLCCFERQSIGFNSDYIEFSLSTTGANETDYILWINVPILEGQRLIEKYKLEELC